MLYLQLPPFCVRNGSLGLFYLSTCHKNLTFYLLIYFYFLFITFCLQFYYFVVCYLMSYIKSLANYFLSLRKIFRNKFFSKYLGAIYITFWFAIIFLFGSLFFSGYTIIVFCFVFFFDRLVIWSGLLVLISVYIHIFWLL